MEWFFTREKLEHEFTCFLPFGFLGAILGARLGHFLFYAPDMLIENPMVLLLFNQEKGMASHGAFLGLMIAFYLCPKNANHCHSSGFMSEQLSPCSLVAFLSVAATSLTRKFSANQAIAGWQ